MAPPPEPRRPREPRLPEPYESDWSPRPIPQPAPERRTADPKTPTLKELAERERQRTSLVVASAARDAVGTGPKPQAVPCTATGLATSGHAAAFKADMQQLRGSWAQLSKLQRAEGIKDAVNAQLTQSGVPRIDVNASNALGVDGYFVAPSWRVLIDAGLIGEDGKPLGDREFERLAKTAYHEARHAEQHYLIARRRATLGESAALIHAVTRIRQPEANAAEMDPAPSVVLARHSESDPASTAARNSATSGGALIGPQLPGDEGEHWGSVYWADTRGACAAGWDASYFGAEATERVRVLNDLRAKQTAMGDAYRDWAAAGTQHGAGSADEGRAMQAWRAAEAAWRPAYDRYRALPEEADAFATEGLLP